MQNSTVSVIIPVYNTKEYLGRCVGSVLAQTCPAQVILVDDGSTDGSGALCDALAQKHEAVRAFHRENSGAAASRNFGVAQADSDYVLFLDSDDYYLRTDAVASLLAAAQREQADMVCFHYVRVSTDSDQHCAPVSEVSGGGSVLGEKSHTVPEMIKRNLYTSSSCLKLIRLGLLWEHHIAFDIASRCEDITFCMQLLVCARRPVFLEERFYGYRVREGSTTRTCNQQTVQDTLKALETMQRMPDAADPLYADYMGYVAFQYCTLLINAQLARPVADKAVWQEIKTHAGLLNYHENRIVHMVWLCSRLVGLRLTARLLLLYFKMNG